MINRFQKQHPGIRPAKVLRVYLDNGAAYADVQDSFGGVFRNVQWISPGGGAAGSDSHQPPALAAWSSESIQYDGAPEVMLLFTEGERGSPYILGTVANPNERKHLDTEPPAADNDTEDPDARTHVLGHAWRYNGARIEHALDGTLIVDTSAPGKPVKLHVGASSFVRMSQVNNVTDERVLLGNAFEDYTSAQLVAKINDLQTQVTHLTTLCLAAKAYVAAALPITAAGGVGPAAAPGAAVAAAPLAPFVPVPAQDPGQDLLASVLRISSKSQMEE